MLKRLRLIVFSLVFLGCITSLKSEKNTTYIYPPWKHTWGVRKADPFKLRVFVGNKTKFNDPQGLACVRLNSWDDTAKTGDDDEVTIYGVNSGDNCIIYNKSMYSIGIYGLDDDHKKLNKPWGITADEKGNVFVVDRGNSQIVHLFNPGDNLEFEKTIGGPDSERGQLIDPRGIVLDNSGKLFISDAALGRITVFSIEGKILDVWEGFNAPDGISSIGPNEHWTYFRDDYFVVVVDSLNRRLRKLSSTGEILEEFSASAITEMNAQFTNVVIDYHSQILATDKTNNCIHKFDRNLNYISRFGGKDKNDHKFDQPRGIALHRKFGQIFVAERQGAQYLWVAVDVPELTTNVRTDSIWNDLDIDFYLTEPANCEMDVTDKYGRFLTQFIQRRRLETGQNHLSWSTVIPKMNPNNESSPALPPQYTPGKPLPPGEYKLRCRFRALYSSRKFFTR